MSSDTQYNSDEKDKAPMPNSILKTTIIRNAHGERLDYTFHPAALTAAASPAADSALHAAANPSETRPDTLVILGHGVTGNKDRPLLVALAAGLAARGWPCLRLSYAGNGASEGRFEDCTITKEIDDLRAFMDAVRDDVKIVYIGHSMGGAAGVLTAAQDARIKVLITLAGMTFTKEFAAREFGDVAPGAGVMWDDPDCPLSQAYIDDMNAIDNTLDAAARVTQPWLLVHGTADDVVPIRDGEAAHAVATCKKSWLPIAGAGHAFDAQSYPTIVTAADDWIRQALTTE